VPRCANDLVARVNEIDRAWTDRFNLEKALPSHGAHPCSSIHPAASYVIFRRVLKEEDEVKNGEQQEAEENRA